MPLSITPLYAGALALMYVVFSIRVIALRREAGVSLGDGGHDDLMRRQRIHGTFAEYVPLALILMLLVEAQASPAWAVHGLGTALIAGRILHASGIAGGKASMTHRVAGMSLTFAVLICAAIAIFAGNPLLRSALGG